MGNRPSHRPSEGESGATDPEPDGTAMGRVVGFVRRLVDELRRWVASERDHEEQKPVPIAGSSDRGRFESGRATGEAASLPPRDRPFTRPTRDGEPDNPPDLRARTEDGRLAIYYPGHDGAEITSDTWERVDR